MLEDDAAQEAYFLWRFMIDQQYQGRGYGRRALELFFAHVKTRPGATAVYTSCVPAEGGSWFRSTRRWALSTLEKKRTANL